MIPHPGRKWMAAVESQLQAVKILTFARTGPIGVKSLTKFLVDQTLLPHATPFFWSSEAIRAVTELAKKIPDDAELNSWNLASAAVWWHFEEPLNIRTVSNDDAGVRAICAGWVEDADAFAVICWTGVDRKRHASAAGPFGIVEYTAKEHEMLPSQVFYWKRDESVSEMLQRVRREHWFLYGPVGRYRDEQIIGEDAFIVAADALGRFILGALLWLNSKAAPLELVAGHVERHLRKDYERRQGRTLDVVKVVQLRKRETTQHEPTEGTEKRDWHWRWIVDGHVRNQPVGHGRLERKLIWIDPYMKGPDDKPLKPAATKVVYDVSR